MHWYSLCVQLLYGNNQGMLKVAASCGGPGFQAIMVADGLVPFSFANVGTAGNPAWNA